MLIRGGAEDDIKKHKNTIKYFFGFYTILITQPFRFRFQPLIFSKTSYPFFNVTLASPSLLFSSWENSTEKDSQNPGIEMFRNFRNMNTRHAKKLDDLRRRLKVKGL